MKLLYKPMSLIAGVVAARVAKAAFQSVWAKIDEHEPPKATTAETTIQKVLLAAVLEASTKAAMAALADRVAARTFNYLFGVWPGERPAEA